MSICAKPSLDGNDFDFIEYRFGNKFKKNMMYITKSKTNNTMIYRGVDSNYNVNFAFDVNGFRYLVSIPEESFGAQISILVSNIKIGEQGIFSCNSGLNYWDGGKNKNIKNSLITDVEGDELYIPAKP